MDMTDLEAWMAYRLARLRAKLDEWERNRATDVALGREQMLDEQYGSRMRMQWFAHVAGVGHGLPTGTRMIPEPPETYRGFERD